MAVEQDADRARVGQDARDVGRGGEASRSCSGRSAWRSSSASRCAEVDLAVRILVDGHHVRDRLAPRQLVGVVLVGPDEHDRPLGERDVPAQVVAVVQVGRETQVEHRDQLVHGGRGARAAEDDRVLVRRADRSRMIRRASSRKRVVWRPVPLDSVCVLA